MLSFTLLNVFERMGDVYVADAADAADDATAAVAAVDAAADPTPVMLTLHAPPSPSLLMQFILMNVFHQLHKQ